jgi:catechol 2,3-dioxygenase-like lactoylglutathione lyase family enzyme
MTLAGAEAVRHVGLVVRDLDRALGFYRDLLGFVVEREADEHGSFLETILGLEGARVTTVKLRGPGGGSLLELLRFAEPAADETPRGGLTTPGLTHVAITVEALDGVYARLVADGVPFTSPPQRSPDGRAKVAFCRDPEGTPLELVEALRES